MVSPFHLGFPIELISKFGRFVKLENGSKQEGLDNSFLGQREIVTQKR